MINKSDTVTNMPAFPSISPSARRPTILAVDDDPVSLMALECILERDYTLVQTTQGMEALEIARNQDIDLILLDIQMPDISGYEVCRRLKQDDATREIPVIFLTAAESMGSELVGLSLGAVDYLAKPVRESILLARINNHLELVQTRKDLKLANEVLESKVLERTSQLETVNIELQAKIRQHEYTLDDLGKLVDDLDAAPRVQEQFLSIMSHELRTPLNGIIGMTDLAKMVSSDPEQISFLDTAHASAIALSRLVDRMMEYVDLESGLKPCKAISYDIKEIVSLVIDNHRSKAPLTSLQLQQNIDAAVPGELMGDPGLVKTVLDELIENAIGFTASGKVTISVTNDLEQEGLPRIHFSVQDTGTGISPDGINKLFLPFQQLDSSATRKHEGIGLGLALAKKRVELMGGTIWAESHPGKGACFHFKVPLVRC